MFVIRLVLGLCVLAFEGHSLQGTSFEGVRKLMRLTKNALVKLTVRDCRYFMCMSVLLSICIYLFIYLSIYLFIYLSIYLSIYLYIYLSVYLSIYISIYLSIYLSYYLFIRPVYSICLYMYPYYVYLHVSVRLSIYLSIDK